MCSGCRTGMAASLARTFTGGGRTFLPLPLGRSGWVTTQTTFSPFARRICSEGTANSGVPMKTIRFMATILHGTFLLGPQNLFEVLFI